MACPKGCCPDYRTHIHAIQVGTFPTQPTYTDRKWDLDMAAYKRLRADGLQPKDITGAYTLEREARNEVEITLGHPVDSTTLSLLQDHPNLSSPSP